MADINKNLKSICSFYASEWHLVTMLLPNLDQKINKGVKVTTILEKDLTKEMETLLTKLHLEDKKEIINIGWQKSNLEDIKQLVQNNDCIIINGTKEFIEKTREKIENISNKFLNSMYIEDYSKYIGEVKDYTIADEEEMKFIGISDIDLLSENIFTIENDFEDMAIINGNGKMFELYYYLDEERTSPDTFYGNYYSPFGYYPKDFRIIKVPKQKWVKFNEESINKDITISAIKSYFYNEWIKKHKEYEIDNNYEIAFECYNEEFLEDDYPLTRCEVWFPIKEKE